MGAKGRLGFEVVEGRLGCAGMRIRQGEGLVVVRFLVECYGDGEVGWTR